MSQSRLMSNPVWLHKMENAEDQELAALLPPAVLQVFLNGFSFNTFTAVQRQAAKLLIERKDVIVQAPTGSGKTLAYLLPVVTILRATKQDWTLNEIGSLIVVPNRELAIQVSGVCRRIAEPLHLNVATIIGGKKVQEQVEKLKRNGAAIIVATPGRFEQILSLDAELKRRLKALEVLIIDEADRLIDMGFKKSITEILAALPKQRRTGLFSATQTKAMEELMKFGLRNLVRVTVADSKRSASTDAEECEGGTVLPGTLHCFYCVIKAEEKLSALIELIRNEPQAKVLVFFSTCSCVQYMKKILTHFLRKRQIFAIHGKKKRNREQQVEMFEKKQRAVMLCTDVMSRGIDITSIDFVVQFDIPRQSSWFIHRSGRCARNGREGKSVLLLTPEEEAYINFIQNYEKVSLSRIKIPTSNAAKAEQLRQRIVKIASSDRDILECGSKAFVSFIESYARHDCAIVCSVQDLDVVGHAHAYGLLRMPRMNELRGRDLSAFRRCDIDTATIAFKEKFREKQRQEKLQRRNESLDQLAEEEREKEKVERKSSIPAVMKKRKRRIDAEKRKEWEELASDVTLLKKFKCGRIGKKELFEHLSA
uniref:ATP-dependent RNA helicase n=1 Tax=Ascaris suum TaxID=6253 RepID=F1KTK1_ASCSU